MYSYFQTRLDQRFSGLQSHEDASLDSVRPFPTQHTSACSITDVSRAKIWISEPCVREDIKRQSKRRAAG